MTSKLTLLGILILVLACAKENPKIDYQNPQKSDSLTIDVVLDDTTKVLVSDLPILIDSTRILIHPIGFVSLNERSRNGLIGSGSFSSSSASGFAVYSSSDDYYSGDITNLLFENLGNGEKRMLTQNYININSFRYLRNISKKTSKKFLLLTIIDRDSNSDHLLNDNDVESLYISNIDGTEFTKITPEGYEYYSGEEMAEEARFYYKAMEDINLDGIFNKADEFHYYFINFESEPYQNVEYYPLQLIDR